MQNNVICAMQSQKVTFDEIELQYSEEHKMYFYPMPEDSPFMLAYDKRERVFLPIPSDTKTAVQHWQQKREEAAKELVDWLISLRYMFMLGILAVIVVFFYSLCKGVSEYAAVISQSMAYAIAEMAYAGLWALGIVAGLLFVRYALPPLFRGRKKEATESEFNAESPVQANPAGGVNINVNYGSGSAAQDIINQRKF